MVAQRRQDRKDLIGNTRLFLIRFLIGHAAISFFCLTAGVFKVLCNRLHTMTRKMNPPLRYIADDERQHRPGPVPAPGATIRDVARLAGVSVATVSRYLNRTAFINPETAERVEAAMRELVYVPSTSARNLAHNKTWTIGLLMESIAGDFFAPLLMGIEAAAAEAGYGIFVASTARSRGGPGQPPLGPQNCDGAILLPGSLPEEWMRRWYGAGFPMVSLYEEPPEGLRIPSVRIENTAAVRAAVLHLARVHGRRRIVFLLGQEGHCDSAERERGYREALAEAGLPFDPALVLPGAYDAEVAAASIARLAASGLRPGEGFDAVYAADDDSAFGALRALRSLGVEVPGRVSVMGFDDQRYAALAEPPLSTVRAPTEDSGRAAVASLLALLEGRDPGRVLLPTEVLYRRSCGCGGA